MFPSCSGTSSGRPDGPWRRHPPVAGGSALSSLTGTLTGCGAGPRSASSVTPCVFPFSPSLPALDWQLPSRSGPYELRIEVQPKPHHRAHYETEGSRGAVKASAGGHPSVQVPGSFPGGRARAQTWEQWLERPPWQQPAWLLPFSARRVSSAAWAPVVCASLGAVAECGDQVAAVTDP